MVSQHRFDNRPDQRVFVELFKVSLTRIKFGTPDKPGVKHIFKALLMLLRSIEDDIRDPGSTEEERQQGRTHKEICITQWISFLTVDLRLGWRMPEFRQRAVQDWQYGPLW